MRSIRYIEPGTAEYAKDYTNGWNAGERCTEGALERADVRNVSHAWYDGYLDSAAGRDKWTWREARRAGFQSTEEYYAAIDDNQAEVDADVIRHDVAQADQASTDAAAEPCGIDECDCHLVPAQPVKLPGCLCINPAKPSPLCPVCDSATRAHSATLAADRAVAGLVADVAEIYRLQTYYAF